MNSELNGRQANLAAVTGDDVDSGVAEGGLLSRFVELTLADDQPEQLTETRNQLARRLGAEGLVDAAAIIGNFQRMVRIADGTGIPLDKPVAVISADLRDSLGLDRFGSADQTPRVPAVIRWLGRKLQPLLIRRLARRMDG